MLFYKTMSVLRRYKKWGYPECDHLNMALIELLKEPQTNKFAIEEICSAIHKAHGYFYDCVADELYKHYGIKVRGEVI